MTEYVTDQNRVGHIVDFHTRGLISWKTICNRRVDQRIADKELPAAIQLCPDCEKASQPKMVTVDLTTLAEAGVLMAANERFFWPLGLALTWNYDKDTGIASELHVTEWSYLDGHKEGIGLEKNDDVAAKRRDAFDKWAKERVDLMPKDEQERALLAYAAPHLMTHPTPIVSGNVDDTFVHEDPK